MYKRILVATDLTDASFPALRAGLEIARRFAAEVDVLHVTQPPYEPRRWFTPHSGQEQAFFDDIVRREHDAAARLLAQQVSAAEVDPGEGLSVRTQVRPGIPSDVIVEVARETGASLVVCGTHARRGLQHAILGSVAERVLRTAPCPVLTVPWEKR